jgi:DNA-directed RNA polymerase III subunit RPC6
MDARRLEEDIQRVIIASASAGVTDADIKKKLPHTSAIDRTNAYNSLLNRSRIQLLGDIDNPRYSVFAQEEAIKMKGLSTEDMLVFQTIENRERMGVWTREIKNQTGLPQAKISKSIRQLEERGLIKAIKSVQNASRKVYILSTLEPAKEITGGPWYGNDQQVDQEFVSELQKLVKHMVMEAKHAVSAEEVCDFVASTRVFNERLELDDVRKILKMLCYEVELEKIVVRDHATGDLVERFRKSRWPTVRRPALTSIPCGICPVFTECTEYGLISPSTCQYLDTWFSKDNPLNLENEE